LVRATWAAQCHVPGHRAILARGQILIKWGGGNYLGYLPGDGMLEDARGRESTSCEDTARSDAAAQCGNHGNVSFYRSVDECCVLVRV
jgi:hypothetical protein